MPDFIHKNIVPSPIKRMSFKKKENFKKGFTLVKEGMNEVKNHLVSTFEQKKSFSETEEVSIIQRSLKFMNGLSNKMISEEESYSEILTKSSCLEKTDSQIRKIENMYNSNPIQQYTEMVNFVIELREIDKFDKLAVFLDQLHS